MRNLKAFIGGFMVGFSRALLPFSFLIAVVIAPITMLSDWRSLPNFIRRMWDEPI